MNLIAGVDPGLSGAIAFLDVATEHVVAMVQMPTLTLAKSGKGSRREISAATLAVSLHAVVEVNRRVNAVWIERVSTSPQMGVTSAGTFMRCLGIVEGIVAASGWPVEYVPPAVWKRALAVPKEKDDARNRACQLMPHSVRHWTPTRGIMNAEQASGCAEAALIALYGLRRSTGRIPAPKSKQELFKLAGDMFAP